jgi:SNF2 family DNA or RNA helicase
VSFLLLQASAYVVDDATMDNPKKLYAQRKHMWCAVGVLGNSLFTRCMSPCRLLLRNHEALSALEASVTTSSGGAKQIVGEGNAWRRLLNLIMQLRKVVNHPFMLPDSEPGGEGTSSLQELLEASGVRCRTVVHTPL